MFSNIKVTIAALLISASGLAQSNESLVREISELARQVRQEVLRSDISTKSLLDVRILLEDALDAARGDSNYDQGCFKFAYAKYFVMDSAEVATNKAVAACKAIQDLKVAEYAYAKYFVMDSAAVAMNKAAAFASREVKGKLDIIEFAYAKYFVLDSASVALDKAGNGSLKVRRGSLQCLQDLYTRYFVMDSAAVAMNKAFDACAAQ